MKVEMIGKRKEIVDRRRCEKKVIMKFKEEGEGEKNLLKWEGKRGIEIEEKKDINRKEIEGMDKKGDVKGERSEGGGKSEMRGEGEEEKNEGDERIKRIIKMLRRDEMEMGIDEERGEDIELERDDISEGEDDDRDEGMSIGIEWIEDEGDEKVEKKDIRIVDEDMVEDKRIGDEGVNRELGEGKMDMENKVEDKIEEEEIKLIEIGGEVEIELDDEISIGKEKIVEKGGEENLRIGGEDNYWWNEKYK